MRVLLALVGLLAMIAPSLPAQAFETIGRSHPLRKVLLDSMRPSVENDLGVRVQFVIDTLRVDGDWAFMAGTAQHPDGSPIDFSQTRYAEAEAEGMFDGPTVRALLQKSGKQWRVATFSIGATDVVEAGWPYEYAVPCDLVGYC